jgi:hypothetical protein
MLVASLSIPLTSKSVLSMAGKLLLILASTVFLGSDSGGILAPVTV